MALRRRNREYPDKRANRYRSFKLHNPVELGQALPFGLMLAAIVLAARAEQAWFGDTGIFLLAVRHRRRGCHYGYLV
jgi:uncharacterized membrane protein (DUF4010 family)